MNSSLTLVVVILTVILNSLVICADINNEVYDFIFALNENLIKFHSISPPFPYLSVPLLITDSHKSKLPLDIYIKICDYLNFNDIIVFSEICKDTSNANRKWLACRLARINPYYVFQQNWVNMLIYKMIEDTKLTHDHLDLIAFKFIINHPNNTRQQESVLRFLYETFYGIDVPLNQRDWRISFISHVQVFDMPKTLEYVNKYYENHSGHLNYEVSDWLELIDFFSKKPTVEEQTRLWNSYNQRTQNHYTGAFVIPDEFEIIFQENFRTLRDN